MGGLQRQKLEFRSQPETSLNYLPKSSGAIYRQWHSSIRKRAKRAIIASQRTRRFARLAQIPRLRKKRLLGMTIELSHY